MPREVVLAELWLLVKLVILMESCQVCLLWLEFHVLAGVRDICYGIDLQSKLHLPLWWRQHSAADGSKSRIMPRHIGHRKMRRVGHVEHLYSEFRIEPFKLRELLKRRVQV